MERQIEKDRYNHILSNGGEYTVLSLAEKYISLKTGVRINTETGYKTVLNIIRNDPFGSRRIDTVRISDAKAWLIKLQREDGKGYSSIHTIRGVLRPAFQMAEDDDLIRKNPFQFPLSTVIINDMVNLFSTVFPRLQWKTWENMKKICRIIRKYSFLFMLCQNELWGYFTKIIKHLRRF